MFDLNAQRLQELIERLGSADDRIDRGDHAVLRFPSFVPGVTYVTAGLSGPKSVHEQLVALHPEFETVSPTPTNRKPFAFELMLCVRKPEKWAPELLLALARGAVTYRERFGLETHQRLASLRKIDVRSAILRHDRCAGVLFTAPPLPSRSFSLGAATCRLLLVLGLTDDEVGKASASGLRKFSVYPYTDPDRPSIFQMEESRKAFGPEGPRNPGAWARNRKEIEEDARRVLEDLVRSGDLALAGDGPTQRLVAEFSLPFGECTRPEDERSTQEGAQSLLAFLVSHGDVEEVFASERSILQALRAYNRTLKARLASRTSY